MLAGVNFLLLTQHTQFAYLDAGTGSLIVQSIIAGALTAGYMVKTKWAAIQVKLAEIRRPKAR